MRFASLIGRYYGMGREKVRPPAIFTPQEKEKSHRYFSGIKKSYDNGVTDEFQNPSSWWMKTANHWLRLKKAIGDLFQLRTDRLRQTTIAFTQQSLPEYGMQTMDLQWYTMTNYKADFEGINVIFDKDNVTNTMGRVLKMPD